MDATTYELRLNDSAGTWIGHFTDFQNLVYTKKRNGVGRCEFDVRADHPYVGSLADKCQLKVRRENASMGLAQHTDFDGIVRSLKRSRTDHTMYHCVALGLLHFLSWREVAWDAETANRTVFTTVAAETIMKTLVDYNICANATAVNGRDRDGTITGFTIQADGAGGNAVDWACTRDNLLETLQKLAAVAGGDFDLINTSAANYQFRWYTGQRGTDRTASVLFSPDRDNMQNPVYTFDRMGEATVCIVGGPGEESAREITIRTGTNYHATTNNIERFVNGSDLKLAAAREAFGDSKLSGWQAREAFEFEVLQTKSCFYGEVASGGHYELGDKVTATWGSDTFTPIVDAVTIQVFNEGGDEVRVEFADA